MHGISLQKVFSYGFSIYFLSLTEANRSDLLNKFNIFLCAFSLHTCDLRSCTHCMYLTYLKKAIFTFCYAMSLINKVELFVVRHELKLLFVLLLATWHKWYCLSDSYTFFTKKRTFDFFPIFPRTISLFGHHLFTHYKGERLNFSLLWRWSFTKSIFNSSWYLFSFIILISKVTRFSYWIE